IGTDWTFKGAGECRVGNFRCAHLLYSKGPSNVSVFALPTEAISACSASSYYESTFESHPMIGMASSESLYAVVGSNTSNDLSMSELRPLAAQVRTCRPSHCGAPTVAVIHP